MITSKKIGIIKVALQFINDIPEAVHLIFSVFIPLRAEVRPEGWIEYVGICEQFDEREEGFLTPQYDFELKREEDGNLVIDKVNRV